MSEKSKPDCGCRQLELVLCGRRTVLLGALSSLAIQPLQSTLAHAATDPASVRPQPGDELVYMIGDNEGKPIVVADLEIGGKPHLAYPLDPNTKVLRDAGRLNAVVVTRIDPKEVSEETKPYAPEGVVAYSAVCTHHGCLISDINDTRHQLVCNCHGSTFEAAKNGEIVVGPATRRLAILPVKLVDGKVTVAAAFVGRLGPPQA